MTTPTTGARIKAARAQLGLTQVQVSKMLGHKTASQVSGWENGTNEPQQANLDLLERKLFSKVAKLNAEAEKADKKTKAPEAPARAPAAPASTFSLPVLRTLELVKMLRKIEAAAGSPLVLNFLQSAKTAGLALPDLIEMVKGEG